MANKEEGNAAIDGLNGTQIRGREIKVNEALPKKPFPEKSRSRYWSFKGRKAIVFLPFLKAGLGTGLGFLFSIF